eukprot:8574511-Lingulodinium_polyedra.AAC.1
MHAAGSGRLEGSRTLPTALGPTHSCLDGEAPLVAIVWPQFSWGRAAGQRVRGASGGGPAGEGGVP